MNRAEHFYLIHDLVFRSMQKITDLPLPENDNVTRELNLITLDQYVSSLKTWKAEHTEAYDLALQEFNLKHKGS